MDRTLFRSEYNEAALLAAPSFELHPALRYLPTLSLSVVDNYQRVLDRVSHLSLKANVTRPPCASVYFDSFTEHVCEGPQNNSWDGKDTSVPEWDKCIEDHEVCGKRRAVKVGEFVRGFLKSFKYTCGRE